MRSMKHRPGSTASSQTYLNLMCQYKFSFWDLEQEGAEVEAFLDRSLRKKTMRRRHAATAAEARKINESEPQTNAL